MTTTEFQLTRNPFGCLILTTPDKQVYEDVAPVRAFPIQAPDDGIAMINADGREVAWIDRLSDLPPPVRVLVEEKLAGREFMPEISRITHVTSFATPCTWHVETDRGETTFVLRGEEDSAPKLAISSIQALEDVKIKLPDSLRIKVPLHNPDTALLEKLHAILIGAPGKGRLLLDLEEPGTFCAVLEPHGVLVAADRLFIDQIEELVGIGSVRIMD